MPGAIELLEPYRGFTPMAKLARGMYRGSATNDAGARVEFCDTQLGFLQKQFERGVDEYWKAKEAA